MTQIDLETTRGLLQHPDLAPLGISRLLAALRGRWVGVRVFEAVLLALACGLAVALALHVFTLLSPAVIVLWAAGAGLAALALSGLALARGLPDGLAMARLADRALTFEEKISSTLEVYRHGMQETAVARSLRATTAQALQALEPRAGRERYFAPRRAGLLALVAVLLVALLAGYGSGHLPRQPQLIELGAQDIAEFAELLAEEAVQRDDEVLAEIAEDLEELAERAASESRSERFVADLQETLQRAGSRFGSNPAHNFPPFEGASAGLTDRVQQFMQAGATSSPSSIPGGGGVDASLEDLASDDIRAMSIGAGGDDGASMGLSPGEGDGGDGAIEDAASGRELEMPAPQMEGQAEGSGMGQTNMAGTGESDGDGAVLPLDALPPPGFAATEQLEATQREDGATTRVSMDVDETPTEIQAVETGRDWSFIEPVAVGRQMVPPESQSAVEAYFVRNQEQQE